MAELPTDQFKIPLTYFDHPEWLRLEALNLVVPVNAETEGGGLTRPVGDQGGVEISVFSLKKPCLESSEGTPDPQIQLLSGLDRFRLVLVGSAEGGHRGPGRNKNNYYHE